MSSIKNIPKKIITEHINWHKNPGNVSSGGRAINPWPMGAVLPTMGSGEEFLIWHKGYLERFYTWVSSLTASNRPKEDEIKPWNTIPKGLKMGMVGWNNNRASDESRLSNMLNFQNLDELGQFLEWGLHGWLHRASASMWNEQILTTFESPKSTYFWQLHGLIDYWREQWVEQNKARIFEHTSRVINNEPLRISPTVLIRHNEFKNQFNNSWIRPSIKKELKPLEEEWKYVFQDIEHQVIPIPVGQYFHALGQSFEDINKDYNHEYNVYAINLGLRRFMRPGNLLKESDFSKKNTVLELRFILEDYYII